MPTFSIESPQTGQTYQVQFDREPSPEDLDFAAKQFDSEWWQQQGIEPGSEITQQTPLETVGNAIVNVGPTLAGMVGGGMRYLDKAAEVVADVTGTQRGGLFEDIAKQAEGIKAEGDVLRPLSPANPTAQFIGQGAAQGIGMLGTAAASVPALGARGMMAVPAVLGFGAGGGEGVQQGEAMGLSPMGQLAQGTAFGAAEAATEMLGGIGGRFLPPAGSLVGRMAGGVASETIEEPAAGALQEAITNVAGMTVADPQRPGFTMTGFQLPGTAGYLERRGQEAIGGAAGGLVFAGVQPLMRAPGVGQQLSEAPAVAPDAVPESTGDLTAEDVADLDPQPMPRREPILTGVPDRMARVRENALNTEPVMEGDVITDLRVPRSPEAIAESQRIENERLAQEAKLRAQEAKARGMPMVADSPTGSRDIVDWANENPIYLPPGFSADRKLPEYDALQRNPLPPYWRQFVASSKQGGNPDSIAQRAFDAGLIAEPTPDAYLQALQEGIAGRQQYRVQFAQRDKALAQQEKRVIDFEKSQTKLAKKKDTQQVPFEDIVPGDQMTIDGEQAVVRNVEYNEDGYLTNVVIEDGKRFGLMQFDPQTRGGLLVDEFKPASQPFAPAANPDQPQTITGSNEQTGSEMPVPPPTAAAGAGAGGVTRSSTTATPPATAARTAPAASVSGGQGVASGGGAGASQTVAPAAGEINLEDVNAELQLAGGFTNLDVSGRTAGFLNTEILAEARQLIADGFTTFANWSQAMVTRFGRGIQEFLQGIWQQITSPQTNAAQNVRLGMPQGNAPVSIGAGGFVGGGQASNIPEGQDVTRSRFASPDEAENLYDIQATETMRAESAAWLEANGIEAALAAMEANSPPDGLRIDHLPSLGAQVITRLAKLAESGTEAQRLQADALLDRAGRAWHGKASQEAGRTLQQRAMATDELRGIAPILATKQVLVERADRVVKERFEGGAEGAVQQVKDIDTKASTQAGEELAAQLEGEPDAPELGDNPEVVPANDSRVAELEKQMQDLREQMVREQTQAESTLAQTTSTWQKIMGVLQAAGGRKSSLLTGAKGKLAAMRKAALARKAARRAEGRLSANPVEDFADDAIIGAAILAEGLVEFTNWSQAIMREVGFRSGQDLRRLYAEASKKYLEALEAEKAAPTKAKGTPKQRQAREKINKAQRTAQNILDSLARRYSDPPIFAEGQRRVNAMRELYKQRVKTGMPEAEFVKRAMALGANEGTAGILWEASKLEIDAREMMALEKSRAGLAGYLKKDSPALAKLLDALRKKVAPGMTWAEIFMTLPAEQKARQREIYRRLMLDERLKALNQGERLQLTNELDRAWQRERRKVFVRELEKITGLGKTKKDNDKVKAALPRLLRLMNLGVLNAATFREAMASEFNLRSMTSADVARLRDTFNAAYTAPPGILRNRLLQKGLIDMQKITGSTKVDLLNNGWVASVLSGGQTLFDTATTLATGGLLDTMTGAVGMAMRGRPDVAITAVAEFWRSLPQLLRESGRILGKGELWYLRQFGEEAKHGLEGLGIGSALTGERLLSEKEIRKKALGLLLAYTGRTMAAFDHLTNNATKAGALPIARALNPELYQGALVPSDLDKANARAQAKLELPEGSPTEINRRAREILENGLNPKLIEEAELMGDMAAFQNDPTGFYGGVFDMVKSFFASGERGLSNAAEAVTNTYVRSAMLVMAGSLRAALGAKFIRFAMNWANKQAMLVPGTYLIQKAGVPIFGSQISRTQANYIMGRNVVGMTMMASFYAFLRGLLDKDDEEEGWHLTGGLEGVSTDRITALRAAGVEKLTLWKRDSQGRVVRQVNYKNMPFAAMLAALASTSDERKYLPEKHATRSTRDHLFRAIAIGAMQFKDISAVEGLSELFSKPRAGSSGEVAEDFAERLAKSAARFTTGFIPNALRDVDSWTDSRYFKPESAAAEWVKGVPFLRRSVNDGRPLMNLLGEEVSITRAPWNRQVKDVATSEAGRVLGGLLSRGLNVPGADGDGVVVVKDGRRVLLSNLGTGAVYAYQKAVGDGYKAWLGSDEGRQLLSLPPEQAERIIERRAQTIKRMAKVKAVGY